MAGNSPWRFLSLGNLIELVDIPARLITVMAVFSLSLPAYIIYTYIRMYIYYTHTHILYAHNVCVYIYIISYTYIYMYMYSKRENPLYAETLNGWSHHALSFKNVLAVIGAGERSGCTGLRYGLIMGHTLDIC